MLYRGIIVKLSYIDFEHCHLYRIIMGVYDSYVKTLLR